MLTSKAAVYFYILIFMLAAFARSLLDCIRFMLFPIFPDIVGIAAGSEK